VSQHARQEVNWEFLLNSSKSTLQAYESSRLNFATNLRKEIEQLLQVWVDESSNALLARWLIERKLAADGGGICTAPDPGNSAAASSALSDQRAQRPSILPCAPKPPTRKSAPADDATPNVSDKIFGDKPFTTPRIHAAS
jgi:hypothetical protein